MDAATTVGLRLGSAALAPLIKKLFRAEPPGAKLVEAPVRLSSLVAFGGEKRDLGRRELEKLVRELVDRAVRAAGPHDTPAPDAHEAVAAALTDTLTALGALDMDDVQAVGLGPEGLARTLLPHRSGELSRDGELFHDRLLHLACLHILDHFTRRSTFVARTLVEQSRRTEGLVRAVDLLLERLPARHTEDAEFEERYRSHLARKHSRLTIFGIDVDDEWPLDDAYLSLETIEAESHAAIEGPEGDALRRSAPPRRAERALAGLDKVLLRGVAGAGKTTLVQWLAVTTAEHRLSDHLTHLYGRVPFVLPLRTLTRSGNELPTPSTYLNVVGCPHTPPTGWAERVLSAGRALLLIDGIDEVPEPRRDATRRWLRELLREFPGNVCLVTGRPSAVSEDWLAADGFRELSLSAMNREDVAAFIQRWHHAAGAGQERAEALLAAVRSRQDLGRLATNPLMCGMLCALHRASHGYLPRGREELYEAALRMLLERRDRQRSIDHGPHLDARSQTLLLERLAYWLIRNGQHQMERADAIDLIDQVLPTMHRDTAGLSAEDVYRHLLDRSGMLREPAEGVVDFIHRTFQDYLAARAAVENRDFPLLVRNAHLDQWEDVIRMAVAHGRPEERKRLLKQLIKRGDTVNKHRVRLHLLAMACLEHATQLDPEVRREVEQRAAALIPPRTIHEVAVLSDVGEVVLELLPGPDGLTDDESLAVVNAIGVISAQGAEAALPRLAEFAAHPSLRVRETLLRCATDIDPARFAKEVVSRLRLDDQPHFQVGNHEELSALDSLPDHPYVSLFGDFSAEEILAALGTRVLKELSIHGRQLTRLDFLGRFRSLERLSLIDAPAIADVAPLSTLPLRSLLLRKTPALRDLRALNALPDLRYLYVGDGTTCEGLDLLPDRAPLTDLGVPGTVTDFTGIGTWPHLETLRIVYTEDTADLVPSPESLAAIAALPALTNLVLPARVLRAMSRHGVSVPQVTYAHVFQIEEEADLRDLGLILPGLRDLILYTEFELRVDARVLVTVEGLASVECRGRTRLTHPENLSRVTVTQPLESRY
ncbi:NACHT N-terminal Helical domain 1-containing protein [Streptomyces xiamenensis]